MSKVILIGIGLLVIFMLGCTPSKPFGTEPRYADNPDRSMVKTYLFSTHPLFSGEKVMELYQPVIDRLNRGVSEYRFKLVTAATYGEYESVLYKGGYDFSIANPLQTIEALRHGYRIIGKVADDSQFKGIFLALKSSHIRNTSEARGKTISFPANTAVAAYMMPTVWLHKQGIAPQDDYTTLLTGNQESSIFALLTGKSQIAVTWPPPWESFQSSYPKQAADIEQIWETPTLVNNGLVAKTDIPEEVARYFLAVLVGLSNDADGRKILYDFKYHGFEPANEKQYQPVLGFLREYQSIDAARKAP